MQATEEMTQRVLSAIQDHQAEHGYPPSIRELASACTVSLNTMYRLLLKLEQHGRIEMTPGQARTIRVVDTTAAQRR